MAYRNAVEQYKGSKFAEKDASDTIPDFTKEQPIKYFQPESNTPKLDCNEWQTRLNKITEVFNAYDSIVEADAIISYQKERKYFVSSEGTQIKQLNTYCNLYISGLVKAVDGMVCPLNISYFGFTPAQLPSEKQLLADVKNFN